MQIQILLIHFPCFRPCLFFICFSLSQSSKWKVHQKENRIIVKQNNTMLLLQINKENKLHCPYCKKTKKTTIYKFLITIHVFLLFNFSLGHFYKINSNSMSNSFAGDMATKRFIHVLTHLMTSREQMRSSFVSVHKQDRMQKCLQEIVTYTQFYKMD